MKYVPYQYQKYCTCRIIADAALGLFLDMGLGKTVITLTAINDLRYNRFAVQRVLVIAPKRVAESTWAQEAKKWDHLKHLRVVKVLGTAKQRLRALNTPGDVWVVNRENVPWLVEQCRNAWPFDMVVIDELTSFKSWQAKRWKALTWVRPHIRRIVGLTGTPAPNGLMDLWAQIYLLDGGERLGRRIGQYREAFFVPDKRTRDQIFSYAPIAGADEEIRRRISDICVSMKAEDYLHLPEKLVVDVPVCLNRRAQELYERMEREAILQIEGKVIDAGTAAVLGGKLLQLCNGAVYDANRYVVPVHECKLEAFMELVEGLGGSHALVFYNFQHDRDRLQKALKPTGLRVRVLQTDRDVTDWNAGEIDLLLSHPGSGAYGLNLQAGGHHIIWFGLPWSLELYQQANARIWRQGQPETVIIHRLIVAGGHDEDVTTALEVKEGAQEALLQGLKARIDRVKKAKEK